MSQHRPNNVKQNHLRGPPNAASEALLRLYRAEADVQSQLPKLAMYMGHASIVSTAHYLRWIPAIAEVASARFDRQYGHLIPGDRL